MKPAALSATLLLHTAALGGFYHFTTTTPAIYTGQATYAVALLSGGRPSAPTPIDPPPSATQASSARTDAPLSETTPSSGPAQASSFTGVSLSADYAGTNPKPHYPLLSRKLAEQGTVVLRILVREDGTAGEVRVQQSSGYPLLDESALSAVKQWRFHPASINRRPIAEWYQVAIPFKLHK